MDDVSGDSKGDDNSSPTGDVEAQAQAAVSNVSSDAHDATTEAQAQAAVSSTNQATKTVPGSIEEISEDPDQSLPFPRHYEDLEEVEDESTAKKKAAQHYKVGTVILPRPNEEVREEDISYNQSSKDDTSSSSKALANSIARDIEYLRRTTVSSMGFTDIVDADESNRDRRSSREIPGVTEVAIDSSRRDSSPVGSMGNTAVTPSTAREENDASVSIVPEAYLVTPEDEEAFMLRRSSVRGELILEPEPEVVEAKPVDFCHRHGRTVALLSFVMLVGFGIFVGVAFGEGFWGSGAVPTDVPSMFPSMAPSFDPRPTLEIVRERGVVMCGLRDYQVKGTFRYQLVSVCFFGGAFDASSASLT